MNTIVDPEKQLAAEGTARFVRRGSGARGNFSLGTVNEDGRREYYDGDHPDCGWAWKRDRRSAGSRSLRTFAAGEGLSPKAPKAAAAAALELEKPS